MPSVAWRVGPVSYGSMRGEGGGSDLDDDEAGARAVCAGKVDALLPAGDVKALDARLAGLEVLGGSAGQAKGGSGNGEEGELHGD